MSSTRGFTMVEVLVALVATALIAIAGALLLRATLEQREAQSEIGERLRRFQTARVMMASDFTQIVLRPVRDTFGMRRPAALSADGGNPAVLISFVRGGWDNPGGTAARASLQYVEYGLVDGSLVRRSRPRLDATPETPLQESVLLEGIERAAISFYDGRRWQDRWRAAEADVAALPAAISVDLSVTGLGEIRQLFRTPHS